MGYGYLLTRRTIESADARAVISFQAGPWAQLASFDEADLGATRAAANAALEGSEVADDLVIGLPTIPLPISPKTIRVDDDWVIAIVLARIAPGSARTVTSRLDDGLAAGALRLITPYSHLLLDFSAESEDRLLEMMDEVLDVPEVLRTRVGLARGSDVVYRDPAP